MLDGRITLKGLAAPVNVKFDERGIPRIEARTVRSNFDGRTSRSWNDDRGAGKGEMEKQANALLAELGYPSIAQFYAESAAGNSATETKTAVMADKMFRRLCVEKADRIRAIPSLYSHPCKFVVTGDSGGTWIIDPVGPRVISHSEEARNSIATIVLANDLLLAFTEGRKNPLEAYEEGKIRVTGDLDVAFEFGRALFA